MKNLENLKIECKKLKKGPAELSIESPILLNVVNLYQVFFDR